MWRQKLSEFVLLQRGARVKRCKTWCKLCEMTNWSFARREKKEPDDLTILGFSF